MNEKKWEQENVLRLVKKSRKGVLRVVFSRFGLMALLLILELVLLWMMWRWFNNDFEWFAAVQGVFTVLMFFHLFNSDMDATGKLTWMFLLANLLKQFGNGVQLRPTYLEGSRIRRRHKCAG